MDFAAGIISAAFWYFQIGLVFREHDLIFGEVFIPLGNQFFAGLADVFTVQDRAAEDPRDVQAIAEGRVGAIGNRENFC